MWVLLSLFYFLSLSHISEKSKNSHHAKIVNYNAFSVFLLMVPKHNFIGPFKLFLFIGVRERVAFLKVFSPKLQISKLNIKSTSGYKILKFWIWEAFSINSLFYRGRRKKLSTRFKVSASELWIKNLKSRW